MDAQFLTSQGGMEKFFRETCVAWLDKQSGTINNFCYPQFEHCDYDNKTLTMSFAVQDWMRNADGVMHGGVVSTAFDIGMGFLSCYFSGGALTPTTNLNVTFLRPIPAGEKLLVEARCDMSGRTLCSLTAKAWLASRPEKLTATASATYYTGGRKADKG